MLFVYLSTAVETIGVLTSGFIFNPESQQGWHLQRGGGGGVHGKKRPEESQGEEQSVRGGGWGWGGLFVLGGSRHLRAHLD